MSSLNTNLNHFSTGSQLACFLQDFLDTLTAGKHQLKHKTNSSMSLPLSFGRSLSGQSQASANHPSHAVQMRPLDDTSNVKTADELNRQRRYVDRLRLLSTRLTSPPTPVDTTAGDSPVANGLADGANHYASDKSAPVGTNMIPSEAEGYQYQRHSLNKLRAMAVRIKQRQEALESAENAKKRNFFAEMFRCCTSDMCADKVVMDEEVKKDVGAAWRTIAPQTMCEDSYLTEDMSFSSSSGFDDRTDYDISFERDESTEWEGEKYVEQTKRMSGTLFRGKPCEI